MRCVEAIFGEFSASAENAVASYLILGSLTAASCNFGSSRTAAFSVTGLAVFCGANLSTWPSGISKTRPT